MKKVFLLFVFVSLLCGQVFAVYERTDSIAYSPQFNLRMHYCIPMNATQTFDDGTKIIRRILGFQNHMCRFSIEKYNAGGDITEKTTCELTQPQRIQLINAAKNDADGESAAQNFIKKISERQQACTTEVFED